MYFVVSVYDSYNIFFMSDMQPATEQSFPLIMTKLEL